MKISLKNSAYLISISLLIMTLAAIFAYGVAHSQLIIAEDAQNTLLNLTSKETLFIYELIAWGIIILTDLAVSYGLFIYLRNISEKGAIASGLMRFIYTMILGYAVWQLVMILGLLRSNSPNALNIIEQASVFEDIWFSGLIVFGLHLSITGLVFFKSKGIPLWLSLILIFGGISYTVIHGLYVFFPVVDSFTESIESILSLPMMISELSLALWLIIRGKNLSADYLAKRR